MPVLSRLQRNQIHEILTTQGLQASDCEWSSQKSAGTLIERLHHRPTAAHIAFSLHGSLLGMAWWPSVPGVSGSQGIFPWPMAAKYVEIWAGVVRRDDQAPDLWAEAAKAKEIPNAAGDFGADNSPFDVAEIELLKPQLDEIEAYVAATQPLTEPQRRELRQRFDYLLGSAKRKVGRIDWLNIFIAQIIQLVINQVLDGSRYGDVMQHAWQLLRSTAINFGSKLLGAGDS